MELTHSRYEIRRAMDRLLLQIEERKRSLFFDWQHLPAIYNTIDFPAFMAEDNAINRYYEKLDVLTSRLVKLSISEYTPGVCKPLRSNYKPTGLNFPFFH